MCSAHPLIVFYICVSLCENNSDGIIIMERTQMMEAPTDEWIDGQMEGRTDTKLLRV